MSRADFLLLIARRGDGIWPLPAAIDGLRLGETPTLRFHDIPQGSINPWLSALHACYHGQRRYEGCGSASDFVVSTWSGEHQGVKVEILLYEEAP